RVRAGAARGRVLVGDFGPPYRRVYSLVGDSVNLAARLMARAGPGQLVASAELIAATRVPFPARSLPPLQVKGKRDPVRAVVVTGPPDLAPRLAADDEWPLLGRDGDLAALLLAWQDARSGTGRVVEVVSEPGLGKSRLLAEFAAQAAGDVHLVSCEGYDATTPYAPVRRLVRSLLDITGGDGPVAAGAKLRAAVARRCPQLLPWLPLLATACGAAADVTAEVEALERRFRPARLADTVAELVACLVTRPAVIAVENSQHIDEASAEVFARLGRETPSRPWLFIVTRRPADRGNLLSAVPGLTSLWLTPLEDDDAHELLQRASEREPLAPYEARRLVQQAGGNPLFLRELLQVRREVGDADGLPDSVEAVVAVQIDRLPPAARRLLRAAAVLGTACDWGTLDAVLQADELTPGPGDWVLLDTFVSRTPEGLRFRQPLVRDAAYEGLPYRRRQRLHGFAAEAIELHNRGDGPSAGLLSLHFFRAQRYRAALRYSVMAAERAQAAYANADAAAFFDRAIDCGRRLRDVPPGETAQLAGRLGDVWSALGEFRRAERAYRTARRLLREPVQVAEVKLRLARTCTSAARYEQALRWLGSAMGELSRADREDPGLAARLAGQYAFVRYQQGRPRETRRWAEETIRQALTGESRGALARGYQLLDWACLTMGDFSHGPQAVQALRIWEELDEPAWQGRILNHLGMRAYYLGDWPAALARYARARDIFTRVGDEWCAAIAAFNVAEILTDQGELESAAELTRHVLRVCRAAGTPRLIAAATAQLGSIAARQADGQHAMALLAEAREIFDGAGETASVADVDWRVAECLVFCGRPADALDRVARLSLGLRDAAVSALVPTLHRLRGYALTQLGDAPGALGAIQQALRVGRERGARQDVAFALVALTRWYEHAGESVPVSMAEERDRLLSELGVTWVPAIPLACAGGLRGQPAGEHAATPAVS
ncbi:MAG TPA: AAA family ATPase, partial [Mycobacteriales bacterium]|nr:AAA family ATPase [Mycobacteriales bacterium]